MLGAKVNPSEDLLPPRQETKVAPRVQLDLPHAPRKKADWDSLATELGAEATDNPELPEEAPPAISRAPMDRKPPRRPVRAPAQDWGDGPEEDEVAEALPETRGVEIPSLEDSQELPDVDLPMADPSPASDSERRPRRRRRRGQRHREDAGGERSVRRDAEPEPDELRRPDRGAQRDLDEREESGLGTKRAGHRSVPSWSEAISLMIDGNLANRSTRRRTGPNGGRTRGRRGSKRTQ
jgi:hypothetical protein